MEELRDLSQMARNASDRFSVYDGKDFVLPQLFKDKVKEINSNTIVYNQFSAVIETKGYQNGTLNIYMPNQWFYVASYFTDLYCELMKYKRFALQVTTKERLKILNDSSLNEEEIATLQSLDLSLESKEKLSRFITDYTWWGGAKTIDRGDFYVSPILSHAKLVNASQSFVADLCAFLSDKKDLVDVILNSEYIPMAGASQNSQSSSLQQIFYGAPGTGKSHKIKDNVDVKVADEKNLVFRTTFHPDSDYSTFVGAYKPTTTKRAVRNVAGDIVKDTNKQEVYEDCITYSFIPQAFLQAYVAAWNNPDDKVFLVIEEINRGNCAQIFGDLFQLLDRKNGVSEYPVEADTDLQNYLQNALANTTRTDIPEEVKSGKKLMLPSNLYIWVTMNTSDQSLFPIDSAFKRRWEWKYIKIKEGKDEYGNKLNWKVDVKMDESGTLLPWWDFIKKINEIIASMTSSADKQLGYFFCCAKDGVIDEETFVSKVIFYLWNDVFKDYGFEDASLFRYTIKGEDGKDTERDLTFPDFYDEDGEKVNTKRLTDFVRKVMSWKKTNEEHD